MPNQVHNCSYSTVMQLITIIQHTFYFDPPTQSTICGGIVCLPKAQAKTVFNLKN